MKLLLDSHAAYWAVYEPERLHPKVSDAIVNSANELFISLASLWELSNKAALGRLTLAGTSVEKMISRIRDLNVGVLPITEQDVIAASTLPPHHLDPFDRMLVAQARVHGLTIVSIDSDMPKYDVPILWG